MAVEVISGRLSVNVGFGSRQQLLQLENFIISKSGGESQTVWGNKWVVSRIGDKVCLVVNGSCTCLFLSLLRIGYKVGVDIISLEIG